MIISVAVNGKLVGYVQLPSHSHCQNQEISMLARSVLVHFHYSPVVDLRAQIAVGEKNLNEI